MILLLPNKVFAEALNKEQIIIDTLKNKISFIYSDGGMKESDFMRHIKNYIGVIFLL